jgi:hypothetical protein
MKGLRLALVLAAFLPAALAGAPALAANLTVVELFQSQGCSSCPPANANVMALSEQPDLLALSFGVTYWDQLGWKDTFASPQYTERQWDYARAFHRRNVFTPEVVVNGHADAVGADRGELEALIRREGALDGPQIQLGKDEVMVGSGTGAATVWLVRYDPRLVKVPIARGENGGTTLPHKNVVKSLTKLGDWMGKPATYRLPPAADANLREAVLVQAGAGGAILAAARN